MKKYITCRYCKKDNRLECLFMRVPPYLYRMCHFCQTSARAGKKRVGDKWIGKRSIIDKEAKKKYDREYRRRKLSAWAEAWLMS